MKRRMKNKMAICLTVLMLMYSLTGGAFPSIVKAAGHTRDEAVAWATAQIGKSLDYDQMYGCQCVDLIKYYYNYFGYASYATGNASAYISNTLPPGWKRVYGNYHPGDIAVWKVNHSCSTCNTSALGHVGIISSADSVGFNAVNQNFNSQSYCTQNWFNLGALECAIRPTFGGTDNTGISFSEQKVVSTSDTNAVLYTKINNPYKYQFSKVGCYLYNDSGTLVKSYSEGCTLSTSYVNYNCDFNADVKYTLTPGTNYKYVLYAVVGGKEYKDVMRTFKTTGSTPTVSTVSFKNAKVNFVTQTNAEMYVYIDNPGKKTVSSVGCRLYDTNGTIVGEYSEICGLSTSYVNYTCNCNNDAKITLQPGKSYKYVLYAIVDGKEYRDVERTLTTQPLNVTPTVVPSSPPEATKSISNAINWALQIAEDDTHGYSQSTDRRWGTPDYDCSSFVISAFLNGGFSVGDAVNTRNIRSVFENAGFIWIPRGSISLADSSQLVSGDILLDEGVHTEIYSGSGMMVGAHGGSFSIYDENNPGDDNGEEISLVSYSDKKWDGVLRYSLSSGGEVIFPTMTPMATVTPKPTQSPIVTKTPCPTNYVTQSPTPVVTESPSVQNSVGKASITSTKSYKGAIGITFSSAKNAKKYQVMYSLSSSFSSTKTLWTTKRKVSIKYLKRMRKYYVKVRGYADGYYGKWSSSKKIKTK